MLDWETFCVLLYEEKQVNNVLQWWRNVLVIIVSMGYRSTFHHCYYLSLFRFISFIYKKFVYVHMCMCVCFINAHLQFLTFHYGCFPTSKLIWQNWISEDDSPAVQFSLRPALLTVQGIRLTIHKGAQTPVCPLLELLESRMLIRSLFPFAAVTAAALQGRLHTKCLNMAVRF